MKTVLIDRQNPATQDESLISWRFIADSALSNAGKPFFKPEGEVEVAVATAFRICKVGKSVAQKFAMRYIDAMAPAAVFRISSLYELLLQKGLSTDPAFSFDKSIIVAPMIPRINSDESDNKIDFTLFINQTEADKIDTLEKNLGIPEILQKFTELNTLKTGDIILAAISGFHKIEIGDIIDIKDNKDNTLTVKIK